MFQPLMPLSLRYKYKGSTVRVVGVFHRACEQHGGDTDIHADAVEVLRKGRPFSRAFKWTELMAVIILSGAILMLYKLDKDIIAMPWTLLTGLQS
ncbi:MAG: hypothetical protein ACYC99_16460 [Candidatus Geothermincolia bacterium]